MFSCWGEEALYSNWRPVPPGEVQAVSWGMKKKGTLALLINYYNYNYLVYMYTKDTMFLYILNFNF